MSEMFTEQDREFEATNELCPWCCHDPEDEAPSCNAIKGEYLCTREPGHHGPHVACGTETHAIEVWDQT